ncbi:MAG: YkvA family protein [Myxococcota bacterium]
MASATHSSPLAIPDRYLDAAARPEVASTLRERLPAKLRRLADGRLVSLAREAYGYVTHPGIEKRHKVMAAGALLYLIAPLDAVADWIPGLGYVDDAAVLTALVMSIREAAKDVVVHTQDAASQVVSHAISEAKEAWARRGVSQVCLSLWGATLAASIGLLYYGAKSTILDPAGPSVLHDPFLWACLLSGCFAFVSNALFALRVWKRYRAAPEGTREPLAYAIVSLADWRQILFLSLPVIALVTILALRAFELHS